jgi:hypothetical protein
MTLIPQQVLTFASNIVANVIGTVYAGYIDSLYAAANKRPTDSLILSLFSLFLLGLPLFVIFDVRAINERSDDAIGQLDRVDRSIEGRFEIIQQLTENLRHLPAATGTAVPTPEQLRLQEVIDIQQAIHQVRTNLQNIRQENANLRQSMATLRNKNTYLRILALVVFVFMLITVSGSYISIQASQAFDLRLMALAPVISEQEKNDLLRDWALMDSKAQYDALKAKMAAIATKRDTTLP